MEHTQSTPPAAVTLKWSRESGDGKRAFVEAVENDGWQDLRIEVDTDDCDGDHAKAAMQVVIDRCNSHAALVEALERIAVVTRAGLEPGGNVYTALNLASTKARAALALAKGSQ